MPPPLPIATISRRGPRLAGRSIRGSRHISISNTGQSAEERFIRVTGATKSARAGDGDAVLGGSNIEVKKASSTTINQVRAVKYIPLVVLYQPDGKTEAWYVVPAHEIVRLAASKERGQHTENPFESSTLSVSALGSFKTLEQNLKQATLKAISDAAKYPQLKAEMNTVLQDSKALAVTSIANVSAILKQLKLVP